jgi:hypothetical protein
MKLRIFAGLAFIAVALQFSASALADGTAKRKQKLQTNQLVAMLPASDGVVTLHVQRFFSDALPTILSGNKGMLADVIAKIDAMKQKTGIDIRSFDYVAAGVVVKSTEVKTSDFEPVVIARGNVDTTKLIAAAKIAANGKYREERFGDKVIYIFPAKEIAEANKPASADPNTAKLADKLMGHALSEVALSAISPNTIAFGKPERVRETIEGKTRVGSDLVELLNQKELVVANMASKVPTGLGAFLPLEDDNLGKSLDSIRYIFGSMDVSGGTAMMNVTARTEKNADAQNLFETVDGLKAVGGMLLGGSKRPDQQLYARLISNAKLSKIGSDVAMDLSIPQTDMDALVGILTKKK